MIFDGYIILSIITVIFTYGFVDANLSFSTNPNVQSVLAYLFSFVHEGRFRAALIYIGIVFLYFLLYVYTVHLTKAKLLKKGQLMRLSLLVAGILALSYSAFSYDIFNYMLTAKVSFLYKENPYVVMPIEIPNEPMLAFTRAANKFALYGPSWIVFTYIPFFLGAGSVWMTMIVYKLINVFVYLGSLIVIKKQTKSLVNVALFALNPLVLFEYMVSGHNDLFMMLLAVLGIIYIKQTIRWKRMVGYVLYVLSVFVKFAPLALFPLIFIKKRAKDTAFFYSALLMFFVFLLSPFREEMYPWYAVWFLIFVALLPIKKYCHVHNVSIALSFGLMLRHAPYIATGMYEGAGPALRTAVTIIPPLAYVVYRLVKQLSVRFINT